MNGLVCSRARVPATVAVPLRSLAACCIKRAAHIVKLPFEYEGSTDLRAEGQPAQWLRCRHGALDAD
jgi:hypothetical protein